MSIKLSLWERSCCVLILISEYENTTPFSFDTMSAAHHGETSQRKTANVIHLIWVLPLLLTSIGYVNTQNLDTPSESKSARDAPHFPCPSSEGRVTFTAPSASSNTSTNVYVTSVIILRTTTNFSVLPEYDFDLPHVKCDDTGCYNQPLPFFDITGPFCPSNSSYYVGYGQSFFPPTVIVPYYLARGMTDLEFACLTNQWHEFGIALCIGIFTLPLFYLAYERLRRKYNFLLANAIFAWVVVFVYIATTNAQNQEYTHEKWFGAHHHCLTPHFHQVVMNVSNTSYRYNMVAGYPTPAERTIEIYVAFNTIFLGLYIIGRKYNSTTRTVQACPAADELQDCLDSISSDLPLRFVGCSDVTFLFKREGLGYMIEYSFTTYHGNLMTFVEESSVGYLDAARNAREYWYRLACQLNFHTVSVQSGILGMISPEWAKNADVVLTIELVKLAGLWSEARSSGGRIMAVLNFIDNVTRIRPKAGTFLHDLKKIDILAQMCTSRINLSHEWDKKPVKPGEPDDLTGFWSTGSLLERAQAARDRMTPDDIAASHDAADQIRIVQGFTDSFDSLFRASMMSSSVLSLLKVSTIMWGLIFVLPGKRFDIQYLLELVHHTTPSSVTNLPSLALSVYDHICTLSTAAYEYYETRDVNVFLRNDTAYDMWRERANQLTLATASYRLVEKLTPEMLTLQRDIMEHVAAGEVLMMKIKRSLKSILQGELMQLRLTLMDVTATARACTKRNAPFTVLIQGGPGIGKSSVMSAITNHFRLLNPQHKVSYPDRLAPPLSPSGIYNRNSGEEYWSCYANSNWCIQYDDIAQRHPKTPDFASEIQELIYVINNVAYFPNMAALGEKGRTFVAPSLIIATTNNRGLNAASACVEAGAVLRRFPIVIVPKVKADYAAGSKLDSSRAAGILDLWDFSILEVRMDSSGRAVDVPYAVGEKSVFDLWEVLDFLKDRSLEHFKHQECADSFISLFPSFCSLCQTFKCTCAPAYGGPVVVQASELPFYTFILVFVMGIFTVKIVEVLQIVGDALQTISRMVNSVLPALEFINVLVNEGPVTGCLTYMRLRLMRYRSSFPTQAEESYYMRLVRQRSRLATYVRQNILTRPPNRYEILAGIILSAIFGAAVVHILSSKPTVQGGTQGKPMESGICGENPWKNSDQLGLKAFLGRKNATSQHASFDAQVVSAVGLITDIAGCKVHALNVWGRYWLVQKHYWRSRAGTDTPMCLQPIENKTVGNIVFTPESVKCYAVPGSRDFVLLELYGPNGPDLTKYFPKDGQNVSVAFTATSVFSDRRITAGPYQLKEDGPMTQAISSKGGVEKKFYVTPQLYESEDGDCGAPLFIAEKGRCLLLGCHTGFSSDLSGRKLGMFSAPYPYKEILELKETLKGGASVVGEDMSDSLRMVNGSPITLTNDVHSKCPIRFEGFLGSSVHPLGELVGVARQGFKTAVRESRMAYFWQGLGFSSTKVPPNITDIWKPKRLCLLTVSDHKDLIPIRMIQDVANHYLRRLKTISSSVLSTICVLDAKSTLNGCAGVPFIDAINLKTGAGFGYGCSKADILEREDGIITLPPAVQARIDCAEEKCLRSERPYFVFNASLKDEPMKPEKVAAGKVRVFQAIPLEGLFLLRKYFLPVIAILQRYNFVSEMAVGMNPHGYDWDDILAYLYPAQGVFPTVRDQVSVSKWKAFDGDYQNYDQHQGASTMLGAWHKLVELCRHARPDIFTPEVCRAMHTLAEECSFALVNYFGDLMFFNGSNPSGHALTVIINSIVNSFYMRIAWLWLFKTLDAFDANVRLITYGDDNVVSVSPEYQSRFNLVTVQETLALFNIVYTNASKTEITLPFVEKEEISFLKRRWIWNEAGFYSAPLEKTSIYNMLILQKRDSLQEDDRCISVLLSSVMEAFHHGESFYNDHVEQCKECVRELGLERWLEYKTDGKGFQTFASRVESRLANKSRKTLEAGL